MASTRRNSYQLILLVSIAIILYGCAVGPNFKPPTKPDTTHYTSSSLPHKTTHIAAGGNAGKSQIFVADEDIPAQWWYLFHSRQINRLIEEGLKNSPSLFSAEKKLQVAAQTLRAQIGLLLLPAGTLAAGAERTQIISLQYGVFAPPTILSLYNTIAQVTYNFDIFGGARRQVEYFKSQVDYQRYQLMATYLSLTSNIVTTAIMIASLEAQIKTTKQLIAAESKILNINIKQLALGGISKEDVSVQQTLLAQTEATLPPLQKSLAEEQHALAVLVGRFTSQGPDLSINLDRLNLPTELPVSLPSKLVEQRPDIQAAEALLHGASAKIGVATANFLPQISLVANYGWIANTPANLFQPFSNTWAIGGNILQTLFKGGALIAQHRAAIAEFKEFYADYQQVVLQAFKNVADALRAIQIDAREFKYDVKAEKAAQETFNITQKRYQLGGQDYLTVLNAEQQYLKTKIDRIRVQALRLTDTAALFQALGGGWWNQPPINTSPKVDQDWSVQS